MEITFDRIESLFLGISQKPSYWNVPCHCPALRRTHDIQQLSVKLKKIKRNPFKVFFWQLNFISFILFPVLLSSSSIVRSDGQFVACLVDFSIIFSFPFVSRRVTSLVHQYRVPLLDLVEYENPRGWRLWRATMPHRTPITLATFLSLFTLDCRFYGLYNNLMFINWSSGNSGNSSAISAHIDSTQLSRIMLPKILWTSLWAASSEL